MGKQKAYVVEIFYERIYNGIYSRKLLYFKSSPRKPDKCVLENLLSHVNANLLCYFVCGNSSYTWVKQHLKSLDFKQLDVEETIYLLFSLVRCVLCLLYPFIPLLLTVFYGSIGRI